MPSSSLGHRTTPKLASERLLVESGLIDGIGFLLSRAGVLTAEVAARALAPLGLTPQGLMVLSLAAIEPHPSQREMSQVLHLHPSRVVALIDGLEELEAVQRATSPTDRRVNQVAITETGKTLHAKATTRLAAAHARQLAHLDPKLIEGAVPLLRQIALID